MIFHVILCTGLMQSLAAFESETIRGHPCVKRNKQIYCPLPGNKSANSLPSLHPTSRIHSDLAQGPAMYYHRFNASQSKVHEVYYTKQYGEYSGQNAFDLNDEDEHIFMHYGDIDEHVIEHNNQLRILKREQINTFIDENKALIKRMFGEAHPEAEWMHPDSQHHQLSSFLHGADRKLRPKRSIRHSMRSTKKRDVCDSTVEIVTPYWASNSEGKIRAIVNSQHLQQAIQQEVCKAVQTKRCNNDCSCEQKYKWHRLLSYDPDMECKGIFMDWFLMPSSCQCMCEE